MVISAPPATAPPVTALPASVMRTANPAPHGWTTHKVKPGETLIAIATRYRTTVGVIAARNEIRNRSHIVAGTTLTVPRTSAPKAATTSPKKASRVHVVRSGDTLIGIAGRYKVPLASLLKTNRLSSRAFIHPGQKIVVRGAASASAARGAAKSTAARGATKGTAYRVRAGDTLGSIAIRHKTSVGAIARASGISTRALIHPGQRLTIPVRPAKAKAKASVPDTFNGVKYPRAVAEAAARNRAALAKRSLPTRTETKAMIIDTARRHGVDPKLALAVAYMESGWNQRVVSPANAIGVMQVIPEGGRWASDLTGRRLDLLKPQDNVTAGVVMLRALGRSTTSTEDAVAAYYQGLGALQRHGMYQDTKAYVRTIMALRKTM